MHQAPEWAQEKAAGRPEKYGLAKLELYEVKKIPLTDLPPSGYQGFKSMLNVRGTKLGKKFVSRLLENECVEVCRVK